MSEQSKETVDLNQLMAQLDKIVTWFNAGDVDIEQAAKKFDEGVKLAEQIKQRLAETENKVNQIKLKLEKFEDQ